MPVSTIRSPEKMGPVTRPILGPATNRVSKTQKQKDEGLKKKFAVEDEKKVVIKKKLVTGKPKSVLPKNNSLKLADGSCNNGSNGGVKSLNKVKKKVKMAKIVPDGVELSSTGAVQLPLPIKRCDWITPHSESLYVEFHDKEWGVPVRSDKKLFELLVLSQALGEITWSTILSKRDALRKTFEDFEPSSVSNFDEKTLMSLKQNSNTLLSELKLRAIVENAKQFIKIQQEFGSFSNYCWRFVNNKPIKCGYRYSRQVPVRTPKSELISKDLMRRGFHCVGPTVIYSFMQVAGLVNDHLYTCFRYNECDTHVQKDFKPTQQVRTPDVQEEVVENNTTCKSQ